MSKTKNKQIITILIVTTIVGAVAFFGGMKYQQSKTPQKQFGQGQNRGNIQGNRNGFRPVNGEIIASDDKSITVKLQDSSSKIVILESNTSINKSDSASKVDLKTGEKVAVFGTENSDGSVTAQNIQLNPMQRGAGGQVRDNNQPQ